MTSRQINRVTLLAAVLAIASCSTSDGTDKVPSALAEESSFQLASLDVRYVAELDAIVFELETKGNAGSFVPEKAGQIDGAPVLGYVFTTTLLPSRVGFDDIEGTLALVVTTHPDFDDTPLWDEDNNAAYDDDGAVYHSHWVVLNEDSRAPGGLAVVQSSASSVLPPTAPMAMYLDSPGFTIVEEGTHLRVLVPADRVQRDLNFSVGGLSASMQVDASGEAPLLAVHEILSSIGDGKSTTAIRDASAILTSTWPGAKDDDGSFDIEATDAFYDKSLDTFVMSMDVSGTAATQIPKALGVIDGAPVLGYVFPTTIPPETIGFKGISGTLALALTSHPDFDDTPFWDENTDKNYGNDGGTYHVHWVVLVDDPESGAGLSVPPQPDMTQLPPTAPMPMYLDSPGYHAFASGGRIQVLVPGSHLVGISSFSFDALSAGMQVDASGAAPTLRVQEVFEVLSGDLSLPNTVSRN